MSKNMAKLKKPACLTDDLTFSFEEYSTNTEDEDEQEYINATFDVEDNGQYASMPNCCRPPGTGSFTVDPTITRASNIPTNRTYIAPGQNIHSEGALPGSEEMDYIDLRPWNTFHIPEKIKVKNISPGRHHGDNATFRKVVAKKLPPGGQHADNATFERVGVKNIPAKGHPKDNATFRKVGETFSGSSGPTESARALHATQNLSKFVFPDDRGETTRNMNNKDNQTKTRTKSRNKGTFNKPQVTYTRSPVSSEYDSSYATEDLTDMGPYRNFEIPSNLRQLNVPHGAHKSFPPRRHPQPLKTFSTHEDQQPILNLREVTEHRKKAPRFYSTPEKEDFSNEGYDQSTLWGQDLSSFQSAETSNLEDSSDGWSQGVRMDSFNIIKYMTPSPKNIKVAPRLMRSHPHLSTPSSKMEPNLTQYSRVVFPDPIGARSRNYDFQVSGSPMRTKSFGDATINIPNKSNITFDHPPRDYPQSQNKTFYSTDGTFNTAPYSMNLPFMTPGNVTHEIPAKNNVTFDHRQGTYTQPESFETDRSFYSMRDFTDMGPGTNFEIPANLQQLNIPRGAHRSFPTTHYAQSPRTFSTHEDLQPIMNLKEVTEHRKRAPRYYSTPEKEDFLNEGYDQSSVWGQDLSSFQSAETSNLEDSSDGWSQGVRMDSFNIIKYMTPSPKNVKVPSRLMQSYPPEMTRQKIKDANLTQYAPSRVRTEVPKETANLTYCEEQPSENLPFMTPGNVTHRIPARNNVTFDHPQGTYTQPTASFETDSSFYSMKDFTDMGPGTNFQIPSNLRQLNVPRGAHRSFPTTQYPQTPRTFSTHEDQQPILNLQEVTEHRKKAPRFYSTPENEDFLNEGQDQSSVWGQDLSSFQSAETSNLEDSSDGWSQGVRMDSFNVIKYMTPSPKNVKVPPRLMKSYPPKMSRQKIKDRNLTQCEPAAVSSEVSQEAANLTYSEEPRELQATFIQTPTSTAASTPLNATRNLTDLGTPSSSYVLRTRVPRPSRNYMTYVDSK